MPPRKLISLSIVLSITAAALLGGGSLVNAWHGKLRPRLISGSHANHPALIGSSQSGAQGGFKAVDGGWEGNAAPLAPLAGSLSFSASQYSVRESDGAALVTLKRTGGADTEVVARVTVTDVTTSRADHLITSGSLDSAFNIGTGTEALALQPDGKIIAGGLRFNPDGSLDNTFHAGSGPIFARTITIQPDGKIIEGGNNALVRLNSDGSTDNSFNPAISLDPADELPYRIRATAVQSDGKILIGGFFNTANGLAGLARLNADGSLDNSFPMGQGDIFSIAVQPDGKILISGAIRLNPDGSTDSTFHFAGGSGGPIRTVVLQPDGKIIIGGDFTQIGGVSRNGIARLNVDGSLDTSFNPGTGTGHPISGVQTVSLQPDGKVFIGGNFAFFNGTPRNDIARVNSDGSLDTSFDPGLGADNDVRASVVQPNGKVVIAGLFSKVDGVTRPGTARLNGDTLVTWPAGDSADRTISLPIINDSLLEGDESLTLTLTPLTGGATLGVNQTATLTIVDDDISISSVSGTGTYNGTATLKASLISGSGGVSGKNINFTFNGKPAGSATTDASGVATLTGLSLAGINAGSYPSAVAASFAGDATFHSSNSAGPLVVAKADQTLTVTTHGPASVAYNSQFSVAATASSGLAVVYSASGNCENAGATYTITSGSGICIVKYDQPGNNNYSPAPQVTETVSAKKARQAISININAPSSAIYGSQFTVAATASSGLAVTYSAAGSCTNSGSLFTMTGGTGTCTVKYDQAGDSNNEPADQLTQTVNAQKLNQTITFGALSNRALGDADFNVSATTDAAGLTVSFAANGQCTVSGATVHLTGAGTCTITASQAGDSNYNAAAPVNRSFTINPPPAPTVALGGATYIVGEGAGSLSVTVNRTGDTTTAVAVDYATSDTAGLTPCNVTSGVASSRCDYATTVGTLRFAAGQNGQTVSIPLVDDGYVEGAETFTVKLSNPVGASLGTTSTSTITITDNDATASNPIATVPFFVRQQYIDFLGREPDPGGFAAWQNILNSCAAGDTSCDRISVSSGFFRSPEFQARGYFIYKFYSASLGRKPLYSEFMPDLGRVSGFLTDAQLEANKVAFVNEFMTGTEYVNRYGSLGNAAFVDMLVQTAGLQSHPLRDAWVNLLNNGSATKAEVLRAFTESLEVYNKFYNEAFVVMQYFGYLRRDPDASYLTWIQTLNQNGGDYRAMISGFINSNEYVQRFGP